MLAYPLNKHSKLSRISFILNFKITFTILTLTKNHALCIYILYT